MISQRYSIYLSLKWSKFSLCSFQFSLPPPPWIVAKMSNIKCVSHKFKFCTEWCTTFFTTKRRSNNIEIWKDWQKILKKYVEPFLVVNTRAQEREKRKEGKTNGPFNFLSRMFLWEKHQLQQQQQHRLGKNCEANIAEKFNLR